MAASPLPVPRDLTIPEPGSTTARAVLSAALRRLIRDLQGAASHAPASARAEASALGALVGVVARSAPGALLSALRRPTVGALLRCLRGDGGADREGIVVELLATLALELAIAGALPAPVRLRRWPRRLLSLAARLALAPPADTTAVILENGRAVLEGPTGSATVDLDARPFGGGAALERPYHAIDGEIVLALADNNPLASLEAHPDKSGNAIDLGGHPAASWTEALGAALRRIGQHLPELRGEMELFVQQIVPVGWDAERHLSASYQEAIGTVYLTLHPGAMTLAEALIHEFSHSKLNALFELDEVLENAWSPLYASPVRPDPRPLHGVLLAVHAFLPVARLYEVMIAAGDPAAQSAAFHARFAQIRRINREGAEVVLTHGRPTRLGQGLLDEIRRWDAHYAAMNS